MTAAAEITGLVLAGGRGSRMGGVDMGLQVYRGRPLAEHAMSRLAPQVAGVWVNANRHLDVYASFATQVCSDDAVSDFAGPLAGMVAGLRRCRTACLATVPCDSPSFPLDLVVRLAEALDREGAELATAAIQDATGWRVQPVFCLMRADLLPRLERALAQGERKVGAWMARQRQVEVRFDDPVAFANINTPLDLQRSP